MPTYVEFFETSAIFIDWNSIEDEDNKLYRKMQRFMKKSFIDADKYEVWKLNENNLIPQGGPYPVNVVIDDLKPIIKWLNDNKIKWYGEKVVFNYENDIEFIIIKPDVAIISYILGEDRFDTKYIPITETKK